MSKWTNIEEWNALLSPHACPFCAAGGPWNVLAELPSSWITTIEQAPMRGYCCLILKQHIIELHDLPQMLAQQLMLDMQRLSQVLAQLVQPVKMNYEIHGNTIPHLHVHFFPRFRGDRFENGPINPRVVREAVYAPGEFAVFRAQLQQALTLDTATEAQRTEQ